MQKAQRYACATRGKRCKRTLYSDEVYVLAFEAEPARRRKGRTSPISSNTSPVAAATLEPARSRPVGWRTR